MTLLLGTAFAAHTLLAQNAPSQPAAPKAEETASAIPWSIAATGARLKVDSPAVAANADEQAPRTGKSTKEGVQVHGWWVIDVKNPDGTVTAHREFENAVSQSGQAFLMELLAGYAVAGDYGIGLYGVCNGICPIVHSSTTNPGSILCADFVCATNLTYAFNISQTATSTMVLSGYYMASQAGSVTQVATYGGPCPAFGTTATSSVSPATCLTTGGPGNGLVFFTSTQLASPPSVASGQIVQVSVTISFS